MDGAPAGGECDGGEILTAAAGWCAPSGTRFTLAATAVPGWWQETPGERREREMRRRWALEDTWLEGQLELTRTVPVAETWPGLVL